LHFPRNILLVMAFACFCTKFPLAAAPANDLFANRILLTGTNVTVQGSNIGTGSEPGEYTGSGSVVITYSVWYTWTAPTNGVVHLSGTTSANNFIMSIRGYRGTNVVSLIAAATLPDGGVPVTPGDIIQIQVASVYYSFSGGGGGTGPFSMTLSLEVPTPASFNDLFANRFDIVAPTSHFAGSIYGATNEPGEPLPNAGAQQTLWWKFVPPGNGVLDLGFSAPQFTPWVTVFQGSLFPSMTPVSPLSGTSQYKLEGGVEYSVQMAIGSVPAGGFTLDTRFYSYSNDMFVGAEHLEGTNLTYYGHYALATFEPGEPASDDTNTVWAAWAAPRTGKVIFNMNSPPWAKHCKVYTGPTLALLKPTPIIPLVNQVASFLAIEGTVYYFQFSGLEGTFTFQMTLYPLPELSNDNFADAQVVKGQVVYFEPKSVIGATMELGEPRHLGAVPQKSIWWQWQAPLYGTVYLDSGSSLVSNVTLAVYTGDSLETLKLAGKGTGYFYMSVKGGETYYIAGAVPTNAFGDIANYLQYNNQSSGTHTIPGNILQEPSWEGTSLFGAQYWHWSGELGGSVNEPGGVDGTTWPTLGPGGAIWQDFPTIPGHTYAIRFAFSSGADAHVRVLWDTNALGIAEFPGTESGFWHWGTYTALASNTISRITFQNTGGSVSMDAFSVVDASAAPAIVTQPASISTVGGGTAAFIVGATGTAPLTYQWFFESTALIGKTGHVLILDSVSTNQSGNYSVVISNAFGSTNSAQASLFVDAPTFPTIVWQPYGDTAPNDSYYRFNVAAIGSAPLHYQWFFNDAPLPEATNNTLIFTNIHPTNAGTYQVSVQNGAGTVWSLPAPLTISETNLGGGTINFRNDFYHEGTHVEAPIFDVDGVTALSGTGFLAQLYAGPSLEWLRPAGQPSSFRTGFRAGYFFSQLVTLANVSPGSNALAQVRVWDSTKGNSYEEARSLGGRFGKSEILSITTGGDGLPDGDLSGLHSFSLQAGLPRFASGTIQLVERIPPATVVWSVIGEPGYRYLVEKATKDFIWRPHIVLTNTSGTVTFTDSANSASSATFYRSRILD
jgi:hypothetical protein